MTVKIVLTMMGNDADIDYGKLSPNYVCSDLKFNLCGEKFNNHLPSAHGDDQVNLKKILHHCNADSNVLLQNTNQP